MSDEKPDAREMIGLDGQPVVPFGRGRRRVLKELPGLFRFCSEKVTHPVDGRASEVLVFELPDWVTVLAVTPQQEIVLVEQERHGTRSLSLELPGGVVDPGEAALAAGERELLEETGYRGRARMIGRSRVNAALQDNYCHAVLVEDAELVSEPRLDAGEHLRHHLVGQDELRRLVREGRLEHSLGLVALAWWDWGRE
ncbi:MAG: NUDIX hydrolase [Acidobacteriota bacterium]